MKIIEYDPKYKQDIYDFVYSVRTLEIGWKSEPEDLYDIPNFYIKDGGNFWMAIDDGRVIGTIALKNMGKKRGYLERMYLAKPYRGAGVAQEMLAKLLDHAKRLRINEVYLGTSKKPELARAVGFYEKMGFVQISKLPEGFFDYGEDLLMKLSLKEWSDEKLD